MRKRRKPFNCRIQPGEVKRNTIHGFGIPKGDLQAFRGEIFFDKTLLTWKCTTRNYKGNAYHRHLVYGNVKSQHCYESRIPNERWNIPIDQQYKEPVGEQLTTKEYTTSCEILDKYK